MNATARRDLYPILQQDFDPSGPDKAIHLGMVEPYDYEQVKAMPQVLEFEGEVYTRTGWNSDYGEVYYTTNRPVAKAP